MLFGVSHILTDQITAGYNFQVNPMAKRSKNSIMLRHDVQNDITMRMSISRDSLYSKKRKEYLTSDEMSYKVTHRPGLNNESDSSNVW